MSEEEWKLILEVIKELEDKDGFVTFPISAESGDESEDYKFYTDDIMKMIDEELDNILVDDTTMAKHMLNTIGIKT